MRCLICRPWEWQSIVPIWKKWGVNCRDDTVDLADGEGDVDGEYTEALKRMESPTLELHPLQPKKPKALKQQRYLPTPLISLIVFPFGGEGNLVWMLIKSGYQHMESPYLHYHAT